MATDATVDMALNNCILGESVIQRRIEDMIEVTVDPTSSFAAVISIWEPLELNVMISYAVLYAKIPVLHVLLATLLFRFADTSILECRP